MTRRGRNEERDNSRQTFVHLGLLKFGLKVGDGAQALHDGAAVVFSCEFHEQTVEKFERDVVESRRRFEQHVTPLFQREHRFVLVGVSHGSDNDMVEQARRPLNHLKMPVVHGVVGTGNEGFADH